MRRSAPLPLLALLLSACGGPDDGSPRERVLEVVRREGSRIEDEEGWDRLLHDRSATVRARAARAIGRLVRPALHVILERALEREQDPATRDELLFALGQSGAPESRGPLLRSLFREDDPARRARAAEALGKLGQDPAVLERLADQLVPGQDPRVAGAALLALSKLYPSTAPTPLEPAAAGLLRDRIVPLTAQPNPDLRWKAVYALAALDLPDARGPLMDVLRSASVTLLDAAPRDRGVLARIYAVRGRTQVAGREGGLLRLARKGEPIDPAALVGLLPAAKDPHLASALALLVGVAAVGTDTTVARDELVAAAARESRPADFHVRAAAVQGLVELCLPAGADAAAPSTLSVALDPKVALALRARLADGSLTVRGEALAALARLTPEAARDAVEGFATRKEPLDRQSAARAAALLLETAAGPLLERLARDEDPRVAGVALEGLGERLPPARARAVAREALEHRDWTVRATGGELLGKRGLPADVGALAKTFDAVPGPELVELRQYLVEAAGAIAARTRQPPRAPFSAPRWGELQAAWLLQRALADDGAAARTASAKAIEALSGARPKVASVPLATSVVVEPGVDFMRPASPLLVDLVTTKGRLVLELYPEQAPHHVKSFCDKARAGFYDGLRFHRVVTGFVAQGLDDRGDGWGTGGVVLRDEVNPVPFETGTLGMPCAAPHTDSGGCQIFLTHIPTPHLNGNYTVFGRLKDGVEVLDALEVGDVVKRVAILEPVDSEAD